MAEKAGLLWPRLPRKLGRGQACQALPGRIFLVSLAKNLESPAWPGLARLCQAGRVFDRVPDARVKGKLTLEISALFTSDVLTSVDS